MSGQSITELLLVLTKDFYKILSTENQSFK